MATTIYVLKLRGEKYYVGRTDKNAIVRFKEHKAGKGSAWTRKYKPIGIERVDLDCDKFDEDKLTKQYMEKYGIGNVRGGTYCQITLSNEIVQMISKELNGGTNKCYNCGKTGHYVKNCPVKELRFSKSGGGRKKKPNGGWKKKASGRWRKMETKRCARCNRDGHVVSQCYATTKIYDSDDGDGDMRCPCCNYNIDATGNCKLSCTGKERFSCISGGKYKKSSQKCYKCGKYGHYASNCYSRKKKY